MSNSEILDREVNWGLEVRLTIAALAFTCIATVFLLQDTGGILLDKIETGDALHISEQGVFVLIVLSLIYGNIVYQLSRLGFLIRDQKQAQRPKEDLSGLYSHAPEITVLVPSYKEEIRVIHQTLLSAALQQYPHKNIVLLIDDPPSPQNCKDINALNEARNIPKEIEAFLAGPREKFRTARSGFVNGSKNSQKTEALKVAALYDDAAQYLENYAAEYDVTDHTDKLFVEKILRKSARSYRDSSRLLKDNAMLAGQVPDEIALLTHYNRLIAGFSATLSSFERKGFENLSHEKNKAMNINTYLGLMGKSWRFIHKSGKIFIEESALKDASLTIPATKYIITLDADSLILPDYALRLTSVMEREGNEKLAVIQTPYSAIHGTDNMLERIAGATTDIQLLIHQGFTWANSTFWVGANALLRAEALEEIKEIEQERGYDVTRYIQDRTVIEDTESSIDLVEKGWSLYNYPARLAYSATPPDYGSLLIQRRRWANGGLIIMPKLLRHVAAHLSPGKLGECFIRLHYLISIAASCLGVLILIMYPFENVMNTAWLPLSAVPYFYLYGRDLCLSGYKWRDLPRVYALNLMLIPINLGGVFKSIEQGITKEKIPFVRTPKIGNRTAAPPLYIVSTALILAYCLGAATFDIAGERWLHAGFSLINGTFFLYAFSRFMGWKASFEDVKVGWPAQTPDLSVLENIKILPLRSGQAHATNMAKNSPHPHEEQTPESPDQYRDAA